MFGRKKNAPITGKIDTLISKAARVQGDVEFSGGLHLDGRVVGTLAGTGLSGKARTSSTTPAAKLRLKDALAGLPLDLSKVKAADLMGEDRLVRHLEKKELAALEFTIPDPRDDYIQLNPGEANVILLYEKTKPRVSTPKPH